MEMYLPLNISEIILGGANGVDTSAKAYAIEKGRYAVENGYGFRYESECNQPLRKRSKTS